MGTNKKQSNQSGFTLIELAIVLAIAALIFQQQRMFDIKADIFEQTETDVKRTIQEIKNIQSAAGGYLVDQDQWPDFANACAGAINTLKSAPTAYLNHITTVSPYNTTYTTECNTNTFTVKVQSDKDFAAPYIAAQHPGSTVLVAPNDDTTASSIPRPEEQPALQQFLLLDGSRAMTGDLDTGANTIILDGQDIKLGIGKFVMMGSQAFSSINAIITKPDCTQGGLTGIPKVVLRLHGFRTTSVAALSSTGMSVNAINLNATQWQVNTANLDDVSGVATTYCDYGSWNR